LHKLDAVSQENSSYIGCTATSNASAGPHQK
jgi:hypothetical protein